MKSALCGETNFRPLCPGQKLAILPPGGKLLLSGILWEYNYDVRKRYQKLGYALLENRMLSEFSTMLLQRRDP